MAVSKESLLYRNDFFISEPDRGMVDEKGEEEEEKVVEVSFDERESGIGGGAREGW